jgi:type I restriction enzyme, S subunit
MVSVSWKKEPLGSIATLQRGFDLPSRLRKRGVVPIITSSGTEDRHSEAKVKGPGVVTGRYGTIGQVFFVRDDFWPLNTTLYVRDFHGNDPLFISYLLRTIDFHTHSGKSGVPGVNRNDLHEIVVPLPPTKTEQEAIAGVLSDADSLIESLEQLIAKKRQIKQGAMQELLTGKKRLPGFEKAPGHKHTEVGLIPADWEVKPLDSTAFVTSGKRLPLGHSLTEHETPHPYIRVTDMRPGTVSFSDLKFVPTDAFPAIKRYRIFKDDIFISVAGTLGIVGKVPPKLDGANLTENADRITNITCSQDYLLHVLMSPLIQNTINSLQTVGAQPKLALTRIRKFDIPLPPTKAEQEGIATILSDMDAEVAGLEAKLAKARQIKEGMVQELLTGRIRLK